VEVRRPSHDDLHGNAPDAHSVALLLVDVINPLDFPEANEFLAHAMPAARQIAALKRRATEVGIPVIYANDNFGRWRSDLTAVFERCVEESCKGKQLLEMLRPEDRDYFVLKPKHSAFYSTTLDLLLRALGTRSLVICGFATTICVQFSANDAYLRDLRIFVPSDCVAANTPDDSRAALAQMGKVLKADVGPSTEINFSKLGRDS
jgi:nicotinamidase-related amidase